MAAYTEFKSTTSIWKHFLRDKEGQTALYKINNCKKSLTLAGVSTRGLHTHLLCVHKMNLKLEAEMPPIPAEDPPRKRLRITEFYPTTMKEQKDNLSEVLARMAAKDCISFNVIGKSIDIRAGLSARGFTNIPKIA